jgi:hypothetical protein
MQLEFEHNFQQKVMIQSFKEGSTIATAADVQSWRSQWMQQLSSWHSPYKALIDCRNLTVIDSSEVKDALERMLKFFHGFFLRKAVGIGGDATRGHSLLPFELIEDETEASSKAGLREARAKAAPGDFRSTIQIQNHFQQHTVEVNFSDPVILDSKDKLADLRSKLTNNLMQWHSKWNLLIDLSNLDMHPTIHKDFDLMAKFFRGLFLKQVIGYSPKSAKEAYPFKVFRSRHKAAAELEAEGNFSGDDANCKSRK